MPTLHLHCFKPWYFDSVKNECIPPEPEQCESSANPVQITSGNKIIAETDFTSAGYSILAYERRYDSMQEGWTFSYRQRLEEGTEYPFPVTVHRLGWRVDFQEEGGVWVPLKSGKKATLTELASGWLYSEPSGDQYEFNADGTLSKILLSDGRGVELTYPVSTPETVVITDDYGESVTLTLDANGEHVVSMSDPSGEEYQYAYTNEGHLEYVSFPDETPGATGGNPFGEDNPVRQYHYTNAQKHLITQITDENDDTYKTINYYGSGRVSMSGLGDGSFGDTSIVYDDGNASGPMITVTNPLGRQTVYHYETIKGVARTTSVEGAAQPGIGCLADVRSKTYYPDTGWLERKTDKAGNVTFHEYYADAGRYGLLKKRIEGEGDLEDERTYEFDWYVDSRLMKQEKLLGVLQTDYTYHSNGKEWTRIETDLTGDADVASRTWTTTYDYHDPGTDTQVMKMTVNGPRDDVTDVLDRTITEYNTQGFMTKVTNAMGHVTEYQNHNDRGQPRTVIDANNVTTHMTYTPRGWLDTITQDVGGIAAFTDLGYDNVGQLTSTTLPDGVTVSFEFDDGHRMDATQNGLGERIEYALDAAGNQDLITYKDGVGTQTQQVNYDFDGLSRLWKEFGNNGQQSTYNHNGDGHLSTIDDGVNPVTSQFFDAQNRLEKVTNADSDDMLIKYDAEDRITQVTDQRGLVTDYVYDGYGNLQRLTSPDTGVTEYDYDAADNRVKQTDARVVVADYDYDALDRLTNVTYPMETAKNITYTYDNWVFCNTCVGRLATLSDSSGVISYVYDALGRMDLRINAVTVPSGTVTLTTDFDFNNAGRLEQIVYPSGQVVKYGFDAAGQVDGVSYEVPDPQNPGSTQDQSIASNIKYQPFGPMKKADYSNSLKLDRAYDQDGRLDTQTVSNATKTVQSLDYGYDNVNNVDGITNLLDTTRTEDFDYDNLNRLTDADGKYGVIKYKYDEVGNRKERIITRGALTITEIYTYPATNNRLDQIDITDNQASPAKTREFEYDDAGNMTEEKRDGAVHMKPHYDDTNRMDSVTPN